MIIADKERMGILTIKVARGERIPHMWDKLSTEVR